MYKYCLVCGEVRGPRIDTCCEKDRLVAISGSRITSETEYFYLSGTKIDEDTLKEMSSESARRKRLEMIPAAAEAEKEWAKNAEIAARATDNQPTLTRRRAFLTCLFIQNMIAAVLTVIFTVTNQLELSSLPSVFLLTAIGVALLPTLVYCFFFGLVSCIRGLAGENIVIGEFHPDLRRNSQILRTAWILTSLLLMAVYGFAAAAYGDYMDRVAEQKRGEIRDIHDR
jgi:hypothetical protein